VLWVYAKQPQTGEVCGNQFPPNERLFQIGLTHMARAPQTQARSVTIPAEGRRAVCLLTLSPINLIHCPGIVAAHCKIHVQVHACS
jgi:hypothetical protein